MDAEAIRRYLQPSPTLRWHPWAPLVAGILLLAFVFYVGMQWGFSAALRMSSMGFGHRGLEVWSRYDRQNKMPAHAMALEADRIDSDVVSFVEGANQPPPGTLAQRRDRLEQLVFLHRALPRLDRAAEREATVKMANLRIAELSAANPRWQATSAYCDERPQYGGPALDLVAGYRSTAESYSKLLGRTIRPEDLAPAVPGGKCTHR